MKNKVRLIFQLIFLGLIGYVAIRPLFDPAYLADFESYCPFGGISSFASKINQGTMACNMSEVQVALGITLLIGVFLVGKLFCSYVCPIGSVSEWLGKLGNKLKIRIEMPLLLDKCLRSLKYVLLFITIYYTMTSSELFCKEYDPYFALTSLFGNSDSVLYFAIPAFVITIVGAMVFRLFWCRYLCPLGAVSNIFLNAIGAGSIILVYVIANVLGADLSFVWLIAGISLVGFITELGFMKSILIPLPKITRNELTCTDCGLCDKKCPQGIKISQMLKVDHIDCTLCSDCIHECPNKTILSVNKKKNLKYLAPVAVVVLIALSLGASTQLNFSTISERWGNFASLSDYEVYQQTGLKNVKCYGSSMALKGKLETVEGIVGLDTYASSHTVKVYYNPAVISEKKVKASLFTPMKFEVRKIKNSTLNNLSIWKVGINGVFDLIDFNYLFYALNNDKGIYGFETHYGEPVTVNIFFDAAVTNPAKIKKLINVDEVKVKKGQGFENVDVEFETADDGKLEGNINIADYKRRIFRIYDREFNDYEDYKAEQLSVFVFPMPQAAVSALRRQFGIFTSHLSGDEGIVRFSTRYFEEPNGIVFYDASKTDPEKIKKLLTVPTLTYYVNDTETKNAPNPFKIKPEGKVLKATEISIEEEE